KNVVMSQFDPENKLLAKAQELPIAVVCRNGMVSGQAAKRLVKAGFKRVHWLDGGIGAWQAADLPLARGRGGAGSARWLAPWARMRKNERMSRSPLRRLLILFALMLPAGCGVGTQNDLRDNALFAYAGAIRWGHIDDAWSMVDPDYAREHPM